MTGDGPPDAKSVGIGLPWVAVVLGGIGVGLVTTVAAHVLPASVRSMAALPVILSALVAGRLAPLRTALAHGAFAWATVLAGGTPWPSHPLSALSTSLLLVEDMALLGWLGAVCRTRVRRRDGPRGAASGPG